MTHRIRMARKRLMVARERDKSSVERAISRTLADPMKIHSKAKRCTSAWDRVMRRHRALRAIERRKEKLT